jgi:D-serine deaminase-like pyridoxal phosphate-dependent protein
VPVPQADDEHDVAVVDAGCGGLPADPAPDAATVADPAFAPVLGRLGAPGSVDLVPTPALLCDVDLLVANVAALQHTADGAGVRLRPHAKSHKSAWVAGLQLDRGAAGICCAKLAEAEALVAALDRGAPVSVLLTSPPVGPGPMARLAALARRCDLAVAVDHVDGVAELAAATAGGGTVTVLCDVDVGLGRTGVTGPAAALAVAEATAGTSSLTFGGVQGYAGHAQHVPGREPRRRQVAAAADRLGEVVVALEDAGHEVRVRTGGGTGTALLDIEAGVLDELQAGSYVFMDREYADALGADPEAAFAQSLTIATTVVSANQHGFVTVDAGLKSMATDAGPAGVPGHPGSTFAFFGDEQGLITTTSGFRPARGDRLRLVPPHCDPTVDRYDRLWLTRGDAVVGVTPVTARGRSY